jgi:hypothetical protein
MRGTACRKQAVRHTGTTGHGHIQFASRVKWRPVILSEPHLSDTNGADEPGTIHRRRQNPVPLLGLHQRDEIGIGAECPDGGGFGLACYPDVRGPGFTVKLLRTRSSTAG